jgi:ATP-dependent RNA helicase DDX35|tara:strand:- start:461 stop:997 length:537 start_codon:yes stop_codon:yes gene_type:complete
MGTALGQDVGYAVRFENVCTPGVTKIQFCTDGVLLRELMDDPLLTKYGVIVVDEAHERSLATDVLLGLLKKIQRRRPDLRVIIASATIQAEEFARFFDTRHVELKPILGPAAVGPAARVPSREPGIISVEGRTFSVNIHCKYFPLTTCRLPDCPYKTDISFLQSQTRTSRCRITSSTA